MGTEGGQLALQQKRCWSKPQFSQARAATRAPPPPSQRRSACRVRPDTPPAARGHEDIPQRTQPAARCRSISVPRLFSFRFPGSLDRVWDSGSQKLPGSTGNQKMSQSIDLLWCGGLESPPPPTPAQGKQVSRPRLGHRSGAMWGLWASVLRGARAPPGSLLTWMFGRFRANVGRIGRIRVNVGGTRAKFDPTRVNFGRLRAELGWCWANFGRWWNSGDCRSIPGKVWPTPSRCWPKRGEFGRCFVDPMLKLAEIGRRWP